MMESRIRLCGRCVTQEDGAGLMAAMRVLPVSEKEVSNMNEASIEKVAVQSCGEGWGPIVSKQLLCREAVAKGDWDTGSKYAAGAYNALVNTLREESGWTIPVIRGLTYEARLIAERADRVRAEDTKKKAKSTQQQGRHDTVRDVEKTLKKGFTVCWTDRATLEDSKKKATLYVVVQLLKIYFHLNLLKLAQPLIRPLEAVAKTSTASFFDSNRIFPQSDVVAYRFFVGRLRMFEDQYNAAEDHLAYAFRHCEKSARRNKRAILEFLLPIRIRRGLFPSSQLLIKYGLNHLQPLVNAVRYGDLATFNAQLKANQMAFVARGTFLLLEKVKILVYRNLLKSIFLAKQKSPQIKLATIQRAFTILSVPIDPDEIECILANLIYKNLVKGYIAHEKQILVLSKKNPFPIDAVRHPPDSL